MKIRIAKKITFSGQRYDCYSHHQQIAAIVAINHHRVGCQQSHGRCYHRGN